MVNLLLLPLQSTRRIDSLNLSLVNPGIVLRGFQLYAVEKWIVDRSRPITLLTVYTGHQSHILPVAAYTTLDWSRLISFLKRDGARQRQTEHGHIMVTSLAHFRSDYTIVHIPDGDFPRHRDHLFVNINLLRMNCSGRSALTLDEPSDSTKDRFISTYLIPDLSRDRNLFTATVLELVKLIQAGLSLFGMYSGPLDGLLCDTTVDGIRRWIADVGEPIIGLEPTERIADPMFVSALLSLVLSIRNKLSALGYNQHLPKDPFLHPQTFSAALAFFVQHSSQLMVPSTSNSSNNNTPLTHAHSSSLPNTPFLAPPLPISPRTIVLNQPLIEAIDAAYDSKHRPTESRKVRRVIKEKLDDLAGVVAGSVPDISQDQGTIDPIRKGTQSSLDISNPTDRGGGTLVGTSTTLGGIASGLGLGGGTNADMSSIVEPSIHLSRLVKMALGGSTGGWAKGKGKIGKQRESMDYLSGKEDVIVGASIRALWGGHIQHLIKMREWQELATIAEGRLRLSTGVASEGEEFGRATEEDSDLVPPGSSFLYRTLGSFTSKRNRRRPPGSLDLATSPIKTSSKGQNADVHQIPRFASPSSTFVLDDDESLGGHLSGGAPNSPPAGPEPQKPKVANLSSSRHSRKQREVSWSRDDLSDMSRSFDDTDDLPYSVCLDDTFVGRGKNYSSLERRRSFHDLKSLRDILVLTPEQMRIDVELCGQMLVMVRREEHLRNVIGCLQVLESSLSSASTLLREDYESYLDFIASLDPNGMFADVNSEYKKAEEISQQTKTLKYEMEQFNTAELWHASNHSRQKVFELRNKVFGAGARRLPNGIHGAHGHYNRLQWTLDGQPRLVDAYGRTEKEVEEEARADPSGLFSLPAPEEVEDVIEHPSIKPMWLLEFFTQWGARWGTQATTGQPEQEHTSIGNSTALESRQKKNLQGPT